MKPVVDIKIPQFENLGTITVDSNFFINTKKGVVSGYDARSVIVSSIYHHFYRNLEESLEYITEKYTNYKEMCKQLKSMVSTGSVNYLYDSTTERILFPRDRGTILQSREYISSKINLDKHCKFSWINTFKSIDKFIHSEM